MPDQVLLDAAQMLKVARAKLLHLANVTSCTEEHERKVRAEILANLHAAIARIE